MQLRRARAQGLPTYLCYIQKQSEDEQKEEEANQEPTSLNPDTYAQDIHTRHESAEDFTEPLDHPDLTQEHSDRNKDLFQEFSDIFGDKLHQDAPVSDDMPEVILHLKGPSSGVIPTATKRKWQSKLVLIYLDNILIFSTTP